MNQVFTPISSRCISKIFTKAETYSALVCGSARDIAAADYQKMIGFAAFFVPNITYLKPLVALLGRTFVATTGFLIFEYLKLAFV